MLVQFFSGPGQAMETLGELDIGQFGQPDFHCLDPNVDQGLCIGWRGHVGLIGDLVEVVVVPAREVDGVTAGDRFRAALVECQRLLRFAW